MHKAILICVSNAPVLLGLCFIAPLIAQTGERLGVHAIGDVPVVLVAVAIGAIWGLLAKARGRWL